MIYSPKNQSGVIALITVLIIMSILLTIGTTAALLGVNELQLSFSGTQAQKALQMTEICAEEAYLKLKKNSSYATGSITLTEGSCGFIISGSGTDRTITASSTLDNFTRTITASTTLTSNPAGTAEGIEIDEWGL